METYILNKELKTLQFSVWDKDKSEGYANFVGSLEETSKYLRENDSDHMEVSALDSEYMHSLQPVSAVKWLIWYYRTALNLIEKNDFDDTVLVPYPTNLLEIVN